MLLSVLLSVLLLNHLPPSSSAGILTVDEMTKRLADACLTSVRDATDAAGTQPPTSHPDIVGEIQASLRETLQEIRSGQQEAAQEINASLRRSVQEVRSDQQETVQGMSACQESVQKVSSGQQRLEEQMTGLQDQLIVKHNQTVRKIKSRQQETAQEIMGGLNRAAQEIRSGQKRMQEQLAELQEQLAAPQPAPEDCPAGWSRHGHMCYLIPSEKTTWYLAHHACAVLDRRARLASVHPASSQHVETLIASSGALYTWVGLARLSGDSGWGWCDGSPLDVTSWAPREPSNYGGDEDCVLLRGPNHPETGWNDNKCTANENFLCQINLALG